MWSWVDLPSRHLELHWRQSCMRTVSRLIQRSSPPARLEHCCALSLVTYMLKGPATYICRSRSTHRWEHLWVWGTRFCQLGYRDFVILRLWAWPIDLKETLFFGEVDCGWNVFMPWYISISLYNKQLRHKWSSVQDLYDLHWRNHVAEEFRSRSNAGTTVNDSKGRTTLSFRK